MTSTVDGPPTTPTPTTRAPAGWPAGTRIDRYRLGHRLGRGGMGEVYEAYDPRLERRIALKLLDGRPPAHHHVAEAKSLARLSHPHVVAVYDAGVWRGHLYVAMELVKGRRLDQWLRLRTRTWREILDVMMQAGRGLAAAHDAQLIHRDVKPSNILVGDDGRVRMADFGLALTACGHRRSGVPVAGTKPYMAPEQQRGELVDARADQFAFCQTLHEALLGAPWRDRPSTRRTRTVDTPRVPAALMAVVHRGLAPAAETRFPSMPALLDALARFQHRRGRRWVAASLLTLSCCLIDVHGGWYHRAAEPCPPGRICIDERPVPVTARHASFDASIQALRGHLDAGRYPLGRDRARALLADEAVAGNPASTARASYWLGLLEERSGDPVAAVETLVAAVAAAERARDDAMRADGLIRLVWLVGVILDQPEDGLRYADLAAAAVERVGGDRRYRRARLDHCLGSLFNNQGDHARALRHLASARDGYRASVGPYHRNVAVVTMNMGVSLASRGHLTRAEGHFIEALAAHRQRLGDDHPQVASSLTNLGVLYTKLDRLDEARTALEEAHTIRQRVLEPDDPKLAVTLHALADLHHAAGRSAMALPLIARTLDIRRAALGNDHPDLAAALASSIEILLTLGRAEEALRQAEEALAVRTAGGADPALRVAARLRLAQTVWVAHRDRRRARTEALRARDLCGRPATTSVCDALDAWLAERGWWPPTEPIVRGEV